MSARRFSLRSSLTFDREPTETNRVLPSFENSQVAGPVAAAADLLAAAGDVLDDDLGRLPAPWCRRFDSGTGRRSRYFRCRRASGWVQADRRRSRTAIMSPLAKTSLSSALPSPSASRRILMRSGIALGDEDVTVGGGDDLARIPQASGKLGDLEPLGARGMAPAGRRRALGELLAEGVSNGFGRSSRVIRRRTPGASVVQSPRASCPVKTTAAAG